MQHSMDCKPGLALRVSTGQVSLKATTNEGLDAVGGLHGIAAWAIAMVEVE